MQTKNPFYNQKWNPQNDNSQVNEMQIEYKTAASTRTETAVQNKKGVNESGGESGDQAQEVGPITLPNGSIYTGQRFNNKKHGRGQ